MKKHLSIIIAILIASLILFAVVISAGKDKPPPPAETPRLEPFLASGEAVGEGIKEEKPIIVEKVDLKPELELTAEMREFEGNFLANETFREYGKINDLFDLKVAQCKEANGGTCPIKGNTLTTLDGIISAINEDLKLKT